jgi:acyl dehydratase
MPGRYFDEWQVGDTVAHELTRTVTETDNVLMTTLTHNAQPLHLDYEAAARTDFKKPLVNSCFTFSLAVGISVADTTLGTLVANLGFDEVKFPKPVFYGDTLRIESEVVALRESTSRPNAGIVTWEHRALNQRDEIVCTMKRTALLLKKPNG